MSNLINEAIDRYGATAQLVKAIEELSELSVELAKDVNGKGDRLKIIDEIADVEIMMEQVKRIMSFKHSITDDEILERKSWKYIRLQRNMLFRDRN